MQLAELALDLEDLVIIGLGDRVLLAMGEALGGPDLLGQVDVDADLVQRWN